MRSPHQRPEAPDGLPVKTIRFEACRSYKPLETSSRLLVNRGDGYLLVGRPKVSSEPG